MFEMGVVRKSPTEEVTAMQDPSDGKKEDQVGSV